MRRPGADGHGDLLTDPAFDLEVREVLERGAEAPQGGGNWRYTLRYDDECTDGWGFRVVLAKLPQLSDGHPAGIITAFRLAAEPLFFP